MENISVSEEQVMDSRISRAVIYRFLSRCFFYPERKVITLFDSAGAEEYINSWGSLGYGIPEGILEIERWLQGFSGHEAAVHEMEKEYTRLFVNAFPHVPAPPYSSVYLDKDRRVWGESTAQAARFYEEAGFDIAQNFNDIPDHIAAELEFVSCLILKQLEYSGTEVDSRILASIERKFMAEHLFRWAPLFLSKVAQHSKIDFYTTVASLTQKFIDYESKQAIKS